MAPHEGQWTEGQRKGRKVGGGEEGLGKTYLAEQPQDLEAPAVDLERRGAGEAVQAVPQGGDKVQEHLRHLRLAMCGLKCPSRLRERREGPLSCAVAQRQIFWSALTRLPAKHGAIRPIFLSLSLSLSFSSLSLSFSSFSLSLFLFSLVCCVEGVGLAAVGVEGKTFVRQHTDASAAPRW